MTEEKRIALNAIFKRWARLHQILKEELLAGK